MIKFKKGIIYIFNIIVRYLTKSFFLKKKVIKNLNFSRR